jgi:hypothetical protein
VHGGAFAAQGDVAYAAWREHMERTVARLDYPGDGCGGSWRPHDVGAYLERVTAWQHKYHRLGYNEFVIAPGPWEAALPRLVAAFYVSKSAPAVTVERARHAHAQFLSAYPGMAGAVPLVAMDVHDWDAPFRAL